MIQLRQIEEMSILIKLHLAFSYIQIREVWTMWVWNKLNNITEY